jgi:hypothetical protein
MLWSGKQVTTSSPWRLAFLTQTGFGTQYLNWLTLLDLIFFSIREME